MSDAADPSRVLAMLTVRDVAQLCQLSERAVYHAIEAGELPGTKLRSRLRIRGADVARWIDAGSVGQAGDTEGHTRGGEFRELIENAQELALWTSRSE